MIIPILLRVKEAQRGLCDSLNVTQAQGVLILKPILILPHSALEVTDEKLCLWSNSHQS